MATIPKPLPILPGGYYARINGRAGGLPCGNTFAWFCSPAPSGAAAEIDNAKQVATIMALHWPQFAHDVMHVSYNANLVEVYPLGAALAPAQTKGMIAPGGQAGDAAPYKLARLVSKKTGTRGRGTTGHNYVGGMSAIDLDADGVNIIPSAWTQLDTAYQAFIAACKADLALIPGGAVWQEATLSRKGSGTLLTVVDNEVQHKLSTMRSRVK